MNAQPKTIRELLLASVDDPTLALGTGHEATAYNFAGKNAPLAPFVLRLNHKDYDPSTLLKALLLDSTHLTPVSKLLAGTHMGQPLIELGPLGVVSILLKQEGTSLEALATQEMKARQPAEIEFTDKTPPHERVAYVEASGEALRDSQVAVMQHIIDQAERHEYNPFLSIFREGYEIAKLGYTPDFRLNNILFDPKADKMELRLIDQLNLPAFRFRDVEGADAANHAYFDTGIQNLLDALQVRRKYATEETDAVSSDFLQLVGSAKRQVLNEQKSQSPFKSKLAFTKVTDVKAISLDDPPEVLVTALQQMQRNVGLSR